MVPSYTGQRGPNGGPISPSYSHQLPAPSHTHSGYPSSQTLPSMAPSTNGGGYGGQNYTQSQPSQPYQAHHAPYQSQQSHPPPHSQAYQQPPPPGSQHGLSSPSSIAPPQSSSGLSQGGSKLDPVSTEVGGRRFSMVVEQQPQRARMCGFGDKDRRPLTPPPAVRLIVLDAKTGQEVDTNTIDYAQFVVTVDLWDEIGSKEVNLVRSTTATPAISSTIHESYNNLETMPFRTNIAPYPSSHPGQLPMYGQPQNALQQQYGGSQYGQVANYQTAPNGYGQPQYGYSSEFSPVYRPPQVYEAGSVGGPQRMSMSGASGGPIQGMFTRNLIGNCAGSAFRLQDTNDRIGIWFVMQDLSVRTEGVFRLRFSFVDVKPRPDQKGDAAVKTGKSPILASVFSDVFQVYSAKKFPGVCDSTELSKCFATQGIKIPIRKEGTKGDNDNDEDDD